MFDSSQRLSVETVFEDAIKDYIDFFFVLVRDNEAGVFKLLHQSAKVYIYGELGSKQSEEAASKVVDSWMDCQIELLGNEPTLVATSNLLSVE